ncbi:MAG: hypothetical protein LW832_10760 [Parachlamydia sp.]|nr:hypothetical protein [Parachlamydia sp.]
MQIIYFQRGTLSLPGIRENQWILSKELSYVQADKLFLPLYPTNRRARTSCGTLKSFKSFYD